MCLNPMAASSVKNSRQLPLDLGFRPALGRTDFLVGGSNAEAAAWIDRWPNWPAPGRGLAIVGPEGAGKSHLAAVWRAASGAVLVTCDALTVAGVPDALGDAAHVAIEKIDGIRDEEALLHLYNTVVERGGSVVILSRTPPARLGVALPDLASRLNTLPVAAIGPPDDALLAGVLAKHFADRQVLVADKVIVYLVDRMERSFAAAERLAERLDRMAWQKTGRIDMRLARTVLAEDS
jgi:chromosomal replication initiation ATPase DnaA